MSLAQVLMNADDIYCISIKVNVYASLLLKLLYILKIKQKRWLARKLLSSFKHKFVKQSSWEIVCLIQSMVIILQNLAWHGARWLIGLPISEGICCFTRCSRANVIQIPELNNLILQNQGGILLLLAHLPPPSSRLRQAWPSCPFRRLWRPGFSLNCCIGILYKTNIGVIYVVRSVTPCLDHSNMITLILVPAWFIEVLLYWFCCSPPKIHRQGEQPYFLK